MSAVLTMLSAGEAQRLTQRIKLTASAVRDNLFKLRNLLDEARNSNAWNVLGYTSWTAYLADTLGDEPLRVSREERQELVGYLAGEGLSTRAIAPIVGVSHETVAKDAKAPVRNLTPEPPVERRQEAATSAPVEEVSAAVYPSPDPAVGTVNLNTGEVTEGVVTERTVTEKTKVTGLDGKQYSRPAPKPPVSGPDVEVLNAETESKALGRALITLSGMKHPEHRKRVITRWWPTGKDAVPPDSRALFEPKAIRDIATWLMQLADDLEVAP